MTIFGDDTPDDEWDASDPPIERLGVLVRRLTYEHNRLVLLRAADDALEREDRDRLHAIAADLAGIIGQVAP